MQSHPAEAPRIAAPPVIRLDGVGKTFRMPDGSAFEAVRGVSLDVAQGDIVGLIGKSGAGKSTLLRLINLLERPDTGSVRVAGRELTRLSRRELMGARQSIGMIFQQFNLLQNATVADNVAFPLRIHGRHRGAEVDARVRECLDVVGLAGKASSYPAQLSGGQKQRVAIARALAPNPQVLLCDEPTSALDTETTRSVLSTLADINLLFGVSIVIVTHELPVVEAICRRVAIVEDGRIAEEFDVRATGDAERLTALGRELDRLVRRRAREARLEAEEAADEERRGRRPAGPAAAHAAASASAATASGLASASGSASASSPASAPAVSSAQADARPAPAPEVRHV